MSHPVFVPAPSRRRGSTSTEAKPVTWGERIAALRYIPSLGKLIWRTHRGFAATILALRILRSLVPVATFWVGKLILDAVLAAKAGTGPIGDVWSYLAIEIAIVIAGEI
ncbi:MAG: hypothetical protein M3365_02355, partial [Gemmatimonadota bacterium]|nr:hypothetical protein [Gemmatimonadota bacterium]